MPVRARPSFHSLESRRLLTVDFNPTLGGFRPVAGDGLPIVGSIDVYNLGTTTSSPGVAYQVVLASDSALTQDVTVISSGTLGAIDPERSEFIAIDYDVPTSLLGKNRQIGVIIDPNNAVAQVGEDNNRAAASIAIAAPFSGDSIAGTDGADAIWISTEGDGGNLVLISGLTSASESGYLLGPKPAGRLIVDLRGGDDSLLIYGGALDVRGGAGNDVIRVYSGSVGSQLVDGGDGDDYLVGSVANDTLLGGDGDDVIDAGLGDDLVRGGAGDDYLRGDGRDATLALGGGNDTIYGDAGRDTIHGDFGDDRIAGGAGGDSLNGGEGDDTLLGQGGRDRLRGAGGIDRLIGGAGRDLLDARDGVADLLSGGDDDDTAYVDLIDLAAGIETRVS